MHGKICYIEIPAKDVARSAGFYSKIFGWKVRTRGDGEKAFDDTTGSVSGTWVGKTTAGSNDSLLTYIQVDSIATSLESIVDAGGVVIKPHTPIGGSGGSFAIFKDSAGNTIGLYQDPPKR